MTLTHLLQMTFNGMTHLLHMTLNRLTCLLHMTLNGVTYLLHMTLNCDTLTTYDLDTLTAYDLERGDLLTGEELSEFADVDMNLSEVSGVVCLL